MWHDMQMWGGMWIWLWPIILVGLGILAYVIYMVLRPRHCPQAGPGYSARNDQVGVAKDRLARGEITPEEFDQIKKRLQSPDNSG